MKAKKNEKIINFKMKIEKKIDHKTKSNSNNNTNNNITNPKQNLPSKFFLNKKLCLFDVEKPEEYLIDENEASKSGRWTLEEHTQFLKALDKFGMKWKKFRKIIKTRTPSQIRSHCQKFFKKLKNCKDEELGIDFTLDNIHNMKDVINHIKSVNENFDVVNILLYISEKYSSDPDIRKSNKIIKKAMNVNKIFEQEIKSNTNDNINNFNKDLDINKINNSNNCFGQNMNFFNFNTYNLFPIYINNPMIINYVNNINNIIFSNNNQNFNNFYI